MAVEVKKEIQLEIAHVLFIDIVGYSSFRVSRHASPAWPLFVSARNLKRDLLTAF
jgi:hypothetical protein